MNRKEAENIISDYIKPVFGFAVKRCRNVQDAEDLISGNNTEGANYVRTVQAGHHT